VETVVSVDDKSDPPWTPQEDSGWTHRQRSYLLCKQDQRKAKKKKKKKKKEGTPTQTPIKGPSQSHRHQFVVTWLREELFPFHSEDSKNSHDSSVSTKSTKSTSPAPSIEHPKQDFHQA
jgi:hypothetical protein